MVLLSLFIEWLSRITSFSKVFTKVIRSSLDVTLDTGNSKRIDWIRVRLIFLWAIVHLTHWGMYIGNVLAIGFLCVHAEWYIALPLVTVLSNPLIGGIHCLYNNLENHYRERLGWPLIEANFLPTVLKEINQLIEKVKSK